MQVYMCVALFFENDFSFRKCGPIVGKLSDCALHQKTETEGSYNVIPMPALGKYKLL